MALIGDTRDHEALRLRSISRAQGADDFMTKPFVVENLTETIKCNMPTHHLCKAKFEGRNWHASDPKME
jgi:DNA-binding response OmpR family regulator